MLLAGILAAVLSGVLMSIQGVCNTGVSKSAGTWTTAAFVSLTAGAVSLGIRLLAGKHESGFSALAQVQPRYLLLGGLFGAFITGTVVLSIARLGTARAELIIVTAQLIAAYGIAVTGWLHAEQEPFSWRKFLALCTALGGVIWYSL